MRNEQQRQADEKQVIPESLFKALIEEASKIKSALICTATRVLGNADKAIRNLMHVCDGKKCVRANMALNKQQATEALHRQDGTASKISLCRDCGTIGMRRKQVTVTQCRRMRDSQHDEKSQVKKQKLSNSMFEHMTEEALHKPRKERGLKLQKHKVHLHKAIELCRQRKGFSEKGDGADQRVCQKPDRGKQTDCLGGVGCLQNN